MAYIGLYAKAFAGSVVSGLGAYGAAIQDGPGVTLAEWLGVAGAVLVSFGAVWAVPNLPANVMKYGKAITAFLLALISSLGVGALDGGLSQPEVITAIIAAISATGLVAVTSNAAESDPVGPDRHLIPVTRSAKANLVRAA